MFMKEKGGGGGGWAALFPVVRGAWPHLMSLVKLIGMNISAGSISSIRPGNEARDGVMYVCKIETSFHFKVIKFEDTTTVC